MTAGSPARVSTASRVVLGTSSLILTGAWGEGPAIAAIVQAGKLSLRSLSDLPLAPRPEPTGPKCVFLPMSAVGTGGSMGSLLVHSRLCHLPSAQATHLLQAVWPSAPSGRGDRLAGSASPSG